MHFTKTNVQYILGIPRGRTRGLRPKQDYNIEHDKQAKTEEYKGITARL